MRYLVLSDLHANLEALEALRRGLANLRVDRVICLGDLVGYNPDPAAVLAWTAEHAALRIRGNHDRAVATGRWEGFSSHAARAVEWTRSVLRPVDLDALASLPPGPIEAAEGVLVCHGSLFDDDEYITTAHQAAANLDSLRASGHHLGFFGHTHYQVAFRLSADNRLDAPGYPSIDLEPDATYLINPGSLGQPRDGDPRAAYAVYDSGDRRVEFGRLAYDHRTTARKILAAGLPRMLADRLAIGR